MGRIEKFLRKWVRHDDIGWKELGEKFTRYTLIQNRWFRVFIHQIHAPVAPPLCHDHPWSFISLILKGGYWETSDGEGWDFRRPGTVLFRPATFKHTVSTDPDHDAWSLVLTGAYKRQWANRDCRTGEVVQS